MTNISRLIKAIAKDEQAEIYGVPCEVLSVNESARTCVVKPYDGSANVYGVRLQAVNSATVGVFPKPKVGSSVIVSFLSKNYAYVSLYSEIDELYIDVPQIIVNGGQNKGVVKVTDMVATFNDLITRVNQLQAYIASHTHISNVPGVPTAPPAPPPTFQPLVTVQTGQFEDTKFKH